MGLGGEGEFLEVGFLFVGGWGGGVGFFGGNGGGVGAFFEIGGGRWFVVGEGGGGVGAVWGEWLGIMSYLYGNALGLYRSWFLP